MASLQSKRTVKLPDDDVNWFRREYPDASLSWILTQLLRTFREASGDETPKKIIKHTADYVLENKDL